MGRWGSIYLIHAHAKGITHWGPSFPCGDLLDSVLREVPGLFLLWPGHWSLTATLRIKVRFSVLKMVLPLKEEVAQRPFQFSGSARPDGAGELLSLLLFWSVHEVSLAA